MLHHLFFRLLCVCVLWQNYSTSLLHILPHLLCSSWNLILRWNQMLWTIFFFIKQLFYFFSCCYFCGATPSMLRGFTDHSHACHGSGPFGARNKAQCLVHARYVLWHGGHILIPLTNSQQSIFPVLKLLPEFPAHWVLFVDLLPFQSILGLPSCAWQIFYISQKWAFFQTQS